MAETATRPTRGARKATPAKAAPAKAAPAKPAPAPETEATDGTVTRYVVTLEHAGDTKSYSAWAPPKDSGCVGKFYAPLGARSVKVAITSEAE